MKPNQALSRRSEAGFDTVLLILFVAIVIVIVGVALAGGSRPLVRSKTVANESSAIASMKTLVVAEEQYKSTSGSGVYATMAEMSGIVPPYIDSVLGRGKKSGYSFVLTVGKPADGNWYATANPVVPGKTGKRFFFVDASGVIRFNLGSPATSNSPAIE